MKPASNDDYSAKQQQQKTGWFVSASFLPFHLLNNEFQFGHGYRFSFLTFTLSAQDLMFGWILNILCESKHSTKVLTFPVAIACFTRMQNKFVYNLLSPIIIIIEWLMAVSYCSPFSVLRSKPCHYSKTREYPLLLLFDLHEKWSEKYFIQCCKGCSIDSISLYYRIQIVQANAKVFSGQLALIWISVFQSFQ